MTKMTYAIALDTAINAVSDVEVKEKLEALKGQLARRNSADRKPTKSQVANEALKEKMISFLEANGAKRANEVASEFEITGQKASALLNALDKANRIERFVEKGVTFFKAVEG
jgi:hypothetical protein